MELKIPAGPLHSYRHRHPEPMDVNQRFSDSLTRGQHVADRIAAVVGSWPFIVTQSVFLVGWLTFNALTGRTAFDPYPFILLNLMLSFQAAYTGPIVMMSQNRQAEKDRLMAQNDYNCNVTAEEEIRLIMEHLKSQDELMREILRQISETREGL
ncbi:MAG: DUF1003 domain-containing protein [Fimbriimonadaceae bacterium]|nr:DUF1003 domain-containing protein [Fimbriimonadaceae bacterium]